MAETSKTLQTFSCGKCSGKGRIDAFGHYAAGRCFDCGGTGRVTFKAGPAADRAAQSAGYTAGIVMEAAHLGQADRATHYARMMLDDLFACGTDNAREVLAYVAAGRYWDTDAQTFVTMDPAVAAATRAEIIALGRARARVEAGS